MVSPLSPMALQGPQVDIAGSLLAGRDAYHRSQLNNQAMQANQQQLSRNDYEQAVERLKLINRLAVKVKEFPQDQRGGFVNSLNQDMLKSVGIDPAQIGTVQLDDQSLDALIAQTSAAMPESSATAGMREFDALSTGLSKEEREKARRIQLGLDPRAVGSASMTIADTGATYGVAQSQAEIEAAKAGAKTSAELDVRTEKEPELQRMIASVKAAEAKKAKSIESGDKYGSLISGFEEAKAIIPLSTGSTIGALRDRAGKVIGYSTDAAQNSARLKALAAWLVTQVPKPGGAVSDADLEQFKKAVGNIDDNTPPEERLAAVDTAMSIINKYQSVLGNGAIAPKSATSKYTIEVMD